MTSEVVVQKHFTAVLEKSDAPGGWTLVGTRGLVKVRETIDGVPLCRSFMALGDGDTVDVTILERFS